MGFAAEIGCVSTGGGGTPSNRTQGETASTEAATSQIELGCTYEQVEVGTSASFAKTISETDVYLFAGISGDFNPVQRNEEFAKRTPFKTRIAHGALPQSLIAPDLGKEAPGPRHHRPGDFLPLQGPHFFGGTVTVAVEEKIEPKKRIRLKLAWTNQRQETVAEGWALVIPPMSFA